MASNKQPINLRKRIAMGARAPIATAPNAVGSMPMMNKGGAACMKKGGPAKKHSSKKHGKK